MPNGIGIDENESEESNIQHWLHGNSIVSLRGG
jgi:hypothetical protein